MPRSPVGRTTVPPSVQLAQQQLEDRALARAIAADDAPALAFLDGPGHVLEHFLGAEAEVDMVEGSEHGGGCQLSAISYAVRRVADS